MYAPRNPGLIEKVSPCSACDAPDARIPLAADDWLDESDDFDGFHQLMHFPELRLAVSTVTNMRVLVV
eukprot:SAG31_NODE_2920_length_4909_cov_14.892100_1_plen_68_part_00